MLTPNRSTTPASALTRNADASADYADKLARARAVLRQAATEYSPATQASSLGAEDVVITHLINALQLDVPIFVLETGALHHETLALLERTEAHSRAPVRIFRPDRSAVIQFVRIEGQDAMYKSIVQRKACCELRKIEPLARALQGHRAWITGVRREQSNARAEVPLLDVSDPSLAKFNPLAEWTWGDVWHYIEQNKVDYNPLHDQFFPSVGCAPCTRAVSLGEDFRAGRWWWELETAKECGLHVKP
jgi:phosphoadenosine phosphosulfate reductase